MGRQRVPIRHPSIQRGALPILLIFHLRKLQMPLCFGGVMAYETEKVNCGIGGAPSTLDKVLNARLSKGWRVVAITPINQGGQDWGGWTEYLLVTFEKNN